MTATADELAAAAACRANPDDVTRLAYADYLDDAGHPVPAELLRCQVELAGMNPRPAECGCGNPWGGPLHKGSFPVPLAFCATCDTGPPWLDMLAAVKSSIALRSRESSLLARIGPWLGLGADVLARECVRCCGWGDTDITREEQPAAGTHVCPACNATGRTTSVTWHRGLATITTTAAAWCGVCHVCGGQGAICSGPCHGTGTVPGLAAAVNPAAVGGVALTDVALVHLTTSDSWVWVYWNESGQLPRSLRVPDVYKPHQSPALATATLATAALEAAALGLMTGAKA